MIFASLGCYYSFLKLRSSCYCIFSVCTVFWIIITFIIPCFYSHPKISGLNFSFVNRNCNIVTHETWNNICSTYKKRNPLRIYSIFFEKANLKNNTGTLEQPTANHCQRLLIHTKQHRTNSIIQDVVTFIKRFSSLLYISCYMCMSFMQNYPLRHNFSPFNSLFNLI